MAHLAGNHVMLRCVDPNTSTNADVLLGHLRRGDRIESP